jgi:predicted AAA+ superfamily ATPase
MGYKIILSYAIVGHAPIKQWTKMLQLQRDLDQELLNWKTSEAREPLVLFGPRQVGKSFAARSFASRNYAKTHEVNFWKNENFQHAYLEGGKRLLDPKKVLQRLELILGTSINLKSDLVLFDEIQDCPYAYEALKFFKEDLPELAIIATGSYLRLFLNRGDQILRLPVGSCKELWLHPIRFDEFLLNANPTLYGHYAQLSLDTPQNIDPLLHQKLSEFFRYYLFTGGLPEVVRLFLDALPQSLAAAADAARAKQHDLASQYKNDLNKYAQNTDIPKIRKIFDTIPLQLNRYQQDSVARFSFKEISGSQGYRVLRSAFDYLSSCGLVIKTIPIGNPAHPLVAESEKETPSKFKAFLFDVGLLQAMLDIPFLTIVTEEVGAYKGYIIENFVAQELFARLHSDLFSFKSPTNSAAAEVEFLLPFAGKIYPIEAKSSYRSAQSKSLRSYIDKFNPQKAFKLTPNRLHRSEEYLSLPIYLVGKIFEESFNK